MQRDIEQWKPNEVARLLALIETERRYYQDLFAALPVAVAVVDASGAFVAVNREFRRVVGVEHLQLGRARLTDYLDAPGFPASMSAILQKADPPEPIAAQTRGGDNIKLNIASASGWSSEGTNEVVVVATPVPASSSKDGEESAVSLFWRAPLGQEPDAPHDVFGPDLQARRRFYLDRPSMGAHESFDYRIRTTQGRLLWLRDHSLVQGSSIWGFTVDVTAGRARETAECERLRREAVERLAARVAHVSNNLLMIVNGYGEEILASLHEADTRREDLQEILKASSRLAVLTQDLSTLARPVYYKACPVSLGSWLSEISQKLSPNVPEGVVLTTVPSNLTVVSNPELLGQLLFEALRYLSPQLLPGNSCVIEVLRADKERCCLAMSLPGLRLDEETAARMFEPFSGTRIGPDPPLGIAGLLRPFENLGGTIAWDLSDPAQPRLTLECPVLEESVAQQATETPKTVLVVEDEPSIRQLIVKSLERHGYNVLQSASPIDALTLASSQPSPPDLLITDLMIPGMDGRTFAARLRERWPLLPVLYVSGFTGDPELTAQLSRGVLPANTLFLAKPFSTRDLLDAAASLLGRISCAQSS